MNVLLLTPIRHYLVFCNSDRIRSLTTMASSSLQLHGTLLLSGSRRSTIAASKSVAVGWNSKKLAGSRRMTSTKTLASTEDLRLEMDENPEGIISGEWPDNFSLLSYADLRAYLESQIVTHAEMKPSAVLGDVMSVDLRVATADQTLEEIDHYFEFVSGLPVVDGELRCIGVVSKTDKSRASNGMKSKVGEVMSRPAITLSPDKTVLDAAALMLKKKVHRIPIVSEKEQVVGIVTRSDIFQALEAKEA